MEEVLKKELGGQWLVVLIVCMCISQGFRTPVQVCMHECIVGSPVRILTCTKTCKDDVKANS